MFQCQLCGVTVPPRTRPARVIVQQRSMQYPHRLKANIFYRTDENRKRKKYETDDPGGMGGEIVQELLACPASVGERKRSELQE